MSNKNILSWDKVAYAARLALYPYPCDKSEWVALEWTWQAWEILIQAGLANYFNEIEVCAVIINFLALICLTFEFLYDEYYDGFVFDYHECIQAINLSDLNIDSNQINYYSSFWKSTLYQGKKSSLFYETILYPLTKSAKNEVFQILINSFGNKSNFYRNLRLYDDRTIETDEQDNEYSFDQIDTEKIYIDLMIQKLNEDWQEIVVDRTLFAARKLANIFNGEVIRDMDIPEISLKNLHYFQAMKNKVIESETGIWVIERPAPNPEYSLDEFADNINVDSKILGRWVDTINRKKQAILQGPPGTGKTFIAEKLAQHLIGGGNGFSELVQFHPAYTYEDFIQGIRPQSQNGQLTYSIVPGRFLEFRKKAESRDGICVLIIDEINRANLAQVFGELMYLLEYRDKEIPLAGGNTFRIPSNVRIIGTMNTADRSITLVDHALRRRFAFIEIPPNYDVLRNYHEKRNTGFAVDGLIQVLQQLNLAIADKNYELGISFFLTEKLAEDIKDIWKMEIEPYLEEYFFDRLEKVDEFRWDKIEKQVLP